MATYQSEFTVFMDKFLQQHPDVDAQRTPYRLTLWDRKIDLDAQRRYHASRVPLKPYVYYPAD